MDYSEFQRESLVRHQAEKLLDRDIVRFERVIFLQSPILSIPFRNKLLKSMRKLLRKNSKKKKMRKEPKKKKLQNSKLSVKLQLKRNSSHQIRNQAK